MYTLNITLADYELLLKISNTEPKIDAFKSTDWIKKNDSKATLHFPNWDALDKFMDCVDTFEVSDGMDENQDSLTSVGIRLQKIYDDAYDLDED